MAAGDRASEQQRAAAERVVRLKRQLQQAERAERAWAAGAAGETLVEEKLRSIESSGWLVLHDVHWPGRPKANLDHVLVGPGGVLVIDAKNWTGPIEIRDGVLYQGRYSREKETTGVVEQCAALTVLLEPKHRHVAQGWLCMVGQPDMQVMSGTGVRIQGLNTLSDAVAALPVVIDSTAVQSIHRQLRLLLTADASPALLTSANVAKALASGSKPPQYGRVNFGRPVPSKQYRSAYSGAPVRGRGTSSYPRSTRRTSKSQKGCMGVIGLLIIVLAVSGMLSNLATAITSELTHPSPHPTPAVTRTLPPH